MSAGRQLPRWPLFLIAAPAAVAVWSGWVGLGGLCGFGLVQPLPGIVRWHLDTAITLPVGVEAYGAYALGAWLTPGTPERARAFARRSAVGALALGMVGQVVYHLLAAAHANRAPWPVVVLVACLPVVTLGFGAGLTHLLRDGGPVPAADTPGDDAADAAEARIQAAADEAARVREWASKVTGQARARVHALEESLAAMRARAEDAERELRDARAVPGLNGHAAEAERIFAGELAGGAIPSIRRIRELMHVGQPKAQQIHAHLTGCTPAGRSIRQMREEMRHGAAVT